MSAVTRFAPSPNGSLHLGHAYSAVVAEFEAARGCGEFLLRIEDIDGPRSRPEFADEFRRDLEWLSLEWREVPAQSTRLETYRKAAERLESEGLVYRCAATRRELEGVPPRYRADGRPYPSSARGLRPPADDAVAYALRLDIDEALERVGELVWEDERAGSVIADPREFGDVVLVRKELPTSYHLAATLDDAADGVALVTRGQDLFASTHIHRVLQELLGLPVPHYLHHDLILSEDGEKLSKSRGSPALADRRRNGEDGRRLRDTLRERYLTFQDRVGT